MVNLKLRSNTYNNRMTFIHWLAKQKMLKNTEADCTDYQSLVSVEPSLETINKAIEKFENQFSGWTIHILTKPSPDPDDQDDFLLGFVSVVIKDPTGRRSRAQSTSRSDNIEQIVYDLLQNVIEGFHEDLAKRTNFPIFIRLEDTPLSGAQHQIKIDQIHYPPSDQSYYVEAKMFGPKFHLYPTVHIYMNIPLSRQGLKKIGPVLTRFVKEIVDDTPVLQYILT